jgi:hypothetical protein
LGLTTSKIKQLALKDRRSGDIHAYSLLPNGEMLFSFVDVTTSYSYRLNSDFKVVASVAMTKCIPSDIRNPEISLRAELAYWAHVAEQL